MIKYFCDYCGKEIVDIDDLHRLTAQDPTGAKKGMHFHSRECYNSWFEKAFGAGLPAAKESCGVKIRAKVPTDIEDYKIGTFAWSIKPYRVTQKTKRPLHQVQQMIASNYLYGSSTAAKQCNVKTYDINNCINKWGDKGLKQAYKECAYATHKVGSTVFDWKKALVLLAGGWSTVQIADEFGASPEEVERLLAIFTGVKSAEETGLPESAE